MTITCEEISSLLTSAMPEAKVGVVGGDGKFEVSIVDAVFDGLNRVKRQQAVYKVLNAHISTGAIHAVSMNLKSPSEAAA